MSPVIVEIGPLPILGLLQIRWYGLMYVIAIIVGIFLVHHEIKRRKLNLTLDDILDFVLITIPIAIVFARLYYVVFRWEYYGQNLGDIYKIWEGGLAIHGGLLGGALALWLFTRWKKISFWTFADLVAPALVLGQALGRFGNFMNGDAYGTPTDLPWGIVFPRNSPAGQAYPEMHIHPTMLYELTGDLLIFGVLWWLRLKPYKAGFLISLYAMLYSALRFVVEFTRGDALCLLGGNTCMQGATTFLESLRTAQVVSVAIFVFFAWLMFSRKFHQRTETEGPHPAPEP
jgi:phosphatidylglycerol:prolipoprotein diacylglycerol transferase